MITNTLHCICGPIAAGKSTLARELTERIGGVRFSIDEWMQALYGPDRPERLDMRWVAPRVARCQQMIWSLAHQVLTRGRDVVLDAGLMTRAERDAVRLQAGATGCPVRMHFVDAPRALRLARLAARNAQRGETYSFEITPAMFEFMEARHEPPGADETDVTLTPSSLSGA